MGKSISRYDVALFTRQLATLVNSGLPIHRSMEVLMRQYIHAPLGLPLSQVQRALGTGHRLAAALAREADVFDSMYVSIVAAGEAQGNLDRTLMELASYLEKETALRERVRSALTYPGFVLAITLLLTWWIFTFVLPQFQPMFQALPGGAPFPTRVLMLIIAVCTRPWAMAIVLGGTAAGLFLALRFLRQPRGRGMWDRASIHLPVFGKLNRKVVMTRITRSLATMMGSGLPIMDVLLQTARTCGNVVYQENLMKAREHLKTGGSLAKFFAQHRDIYPLMFVQMVTSGEETGYLQELLMRAAETFDQDVSYTVEIMVTLIEPMLMTLLAVIVGFIVVAVFLPLYAYLSRLGA